MRHRFIARAFLGCVLLSLTHSLAYGYREYFTPAQRAQLDTIQTILIYALPVLFAIVMEYELRKTGALKLVQLND